MIEINGLSIVHYCHPDCRPLMNIMRLERSEAFAVARDMAARHPDTTAFYRFADFDNYYPRRMEADALLFERFSAIGFTPKERHPLSFVLEGSQYLGEWFGNGVEIRIPLAAVPSADVSFTFGDSMGVLKRNEPLRLVSKESLLVQMALFSGTLEEYMRMIDRECRYIEVQVWNDESVLDYLRNSSII